MKNKLLLEFDKKNQLNIKLFFKHLFKVQIKQNNNEIIKEYLELKEYQELSYKIYKS